jgi:hypothetical protein
MEMEPIEISGFPDYIIHPDGKIYCKSRSCFLNPGKDHAGYIQVGLRPPTGKRRTFRLHRLLAEHFIPKQYGDGDFVDHIDNDRTNNQLSNLRWVTSEQNSQNTKAKRRDTYCIRWVEARKVFEISLPRPDGSSRYVGRTKTLDEAIVMRDKALNGIFPKTMRPPTYCITRRSEEVFEVSIPIAPRKYEFLGTRKTLEDAQQLRDIVLDEREKDPDAWKPRMMGKVLYVYSD